MAVATKGGEKKTRNAMKLRDGCDDQEKGGETKEMC